MPPYTRSVTALGDFLEAVHGAHRSLSSVQGTLREWRDEELISSARVGLLARRGRR